MRLSIFKACCGGGGCSGGGAVNKSSTRTTIITSRGNNVAITGSIVLLLIWSFVGDCGGKPFHSGGQAEVEEDTTQGSLKEKFHSADSLVGPVSSSGGGVGSHVIDDSLPDEDDEDNDEEPIMVGSLGLLPFGGRNFAMDMSRDNYRAHPSHSQLKHSLMSGSPGEVHKRSLGGRSSSPSFSGIYDDDEAYQQQRVARPAYYPSEQTASSVLPASPVSSGENPNLRIRQKLMSLRNQYGDKWYALMGPYAYRKRQILYRQCFFNPISCF